MQSSAVLYTLCVGNLLFIPVSTAEAAIYEFMASPVKRVTYATTTYISSSLIYSVKRFCSHNANPQLYGIATYDALFKYVLSDDKIRPSFLHAFIPGMPIVSSHRLDEHMNPLQKLQQLRNFLHHKTTEQTVRDLMQVAPQNYWDCRSLAYVATFYGSQLHKEGDWKQIKKVIGINILGGGKDDKQHWSDTPQQYVRHYKVQEQLHKPRRFIDGMELIQYSIMNAPKTSSNQEQQDWITFFKEGHYMTAANVKQRIKTKAVLQAFEKAQLNRLPADVRAAYETQDKDYDRFSDHTEELVRKSKTDTKKEVARKMLADRLSVQSIAAYTGLPAVEIKTLMTSKK